MNATCRLTLLISSSTGRPSQQPTRATMNSCTATAQVASGVLAGAQQQPSTHGLSQGRTQAAVKPHQRTMQLMLKRMVQQTMQQTMHQMMQQMMMQQMKMMMQQMIWMTGAKKKKVLSTGK
jgi:hypothetical protein